MTSDIPARYKPLLIAVAIAAAAYATYIANAIFAEDAVTDCCATEFDPAPYQQAPVKTSP